MATQGMWTHAQNMGEPVTFLLQDSDGTALDVVAFLDKLCTDLRGSDPLSIKAERAYQSLSVYISMLDDADAEPANPKNEMEVGIDEWTPFHLAIVVKHAEAISELLSFHQQYAISVLEDLLRDNSREASPDNGADAVAVASTSSNSVDYASNSRECSPLKGTLHHQRRGMELQVRNELGGTVVLLGGEVCGDEAAQSFRKGNSGTFSAMGEPKYTISCVTKALGSLLSNMVFERDFTDNFDDSADASTGGGGGGGGGNGSGSGMKSESGFVTRIISAHRGTLAEHYTRFPSLIIDHDVLYEVCSGDLRILNDILGCFAGLLLPVVNGKRMHYAGSSSRGSSINTSPWEYPQGGTIPRSVQQQQYHHPHHTLPQSPILLSCATQEHQKLAFLAMWISFRETTTMERQPPGSARQNREANVLSDFRVSLWNFKKVTHMTSPNSIWSGHLFVLSRLISRDCALESFLDIVEEGDYASCSTGIPSTFITLIVAGAVVSALPQRYHLLQMLYKKVKTLLVDVPGVFSPLRFYLTSRPTNDAERFEELWLAATPLSSQKKFNSRVDMLYFASVESVLLGAEELWSKPDFFSDKKHRSRVQCVLQDWLKIFQRFLLSLRDKSPNGQQQRRATSKSSCDDDVTSTVNSFHSSEDHDVDALRRLCDALPLRLKHGAPPLPSIYEFLYPQEATITITTSSSNDNNSNNNSSVSGVADVSDVSNANEKKTVGSDVGSAFEAAQFAFSKMATSVSNEVKLKFYGLYKQATVGDVNVSRPWMVDLVGCAKWDAWNALKGMTAEAAKQQYVAGLKALQAANTKNSN
ncbi:Acyl-CoA-binding protein [Trypanosoma melophagium]|uniref:Acyl-CoA-binding protein n=1 Tax=Trypanosoma melophagium TaxID=715481 RepID=UPI00351A8021|nr:Acyl-CoA-binding protein [Trypanosoma melophagium]